jgi:hypothetical protein
MLRAPWFWWGVSATIQFCLNVWLAGSIEGLWRSINRLLDIIEIQGKQLNTLREKINNGATREKGN